MFYTTGQYLIQEEEGTLWVCRNFTLIPNNAKQLFVQQLVNLLQLCHFT